MYDLLFSPGKIGGLTLPNRIAMTAAVGLLASEKGGGIARPECCAISFPGFFQLLGAGSV